MSEIPAEEYTPYVWSDVDLDEMLAIALVLERFAAVADPVEAVHLEALARNERARAAGAVANVAATRHATGWFDASLLLWQATPASTTVVDGPLSGVVVSIDAEPRSMWVARNERGVVLVRPFRGDLGTAPTLPPGVTLEGIYRWRAGSASTGRFHWRPK
jgi:hypothetical protein